MCRVGVYMPRRKNEKLNYFQRWRQRHKLVTIYLSPEEYEVLRQLADKTGLSYRELLYNAARDIRKLYGEIMSKYFGIRPGDLSSLEEKYKLEISKLKQDHEAEIARLKTDCEVEIKRLKFNHEVEIAKLMSDYELRIEQLKREYEAKISQLKDEYEARISQLRNENVQLRNEYEDKIAKLRQEYEDKLKQEYDRGYRDGKNSVNCFNW